MGRSSSSSMSTESRCMLLMALQQRWFQVAGCSRLQVAAGCSRLQQVAGCNRKSKTTMCSVASGLSTAQQWKQPCLRQCRACPPPTTGPPAEAGARCVRQVPPSDHAARVVALIHHHNVPATWGRNGGRRNAGAGIGWKHSRDQGGAYQAVQKVRAGVASDRWDLEGHSY